MLFWVKALPLVFNRLREVKEKPEENYESAALTAELRARALGTILQRKEIENR